jgi:hypothetical protein
VQQLIVDMLAARQSFTFRTLESLDLKGMAASLAVSEVV